MMRALVADADGTLALYNGDLERARSRLGTALAEFRERGERTLETSALYLLGTTYGLSGSTEQAVESLERVLAIAGGARREGVSIAFAVGPGNCGVAAG